MLNLIYDESRCTSAKYIMEIMKQFNMFRRKYYKKMTYDERMLLIKVLNELNDYADALDISKENCDNVGNLYKMHTGDQSAFDEGYNAAIRDAMDTLFGKERYNG